MSEKIYIIEGPDGTGKTTLANEIAEQSKASIVHCSYDKDWDIKVHHKDMFKAAKLIAQWMPVYSIDGHIASWFMVRYLEINHHMM